VICLNVVTYNCSSLSKVVEYLVGDGPNNRYALICSDCHSHNGMVLRDEFEYTTFRCAYCYHLNPARKRKPSLVSPSAPPSTAPSAPPSTAPSAPPSAPPTTQPGNLEPSDTQDLVSAYKRKFFSEVCPKDYSVGFWVFELLETCITIVECTSFS